MLEIEKTSQIAAEMRRLNLAVFGIIGTHYIKDGQKRLEFRKDAVVFGS